MYGNTFDARNYFEYKINEVDNKECRINKGRV